MDTHARGHSAGAHGRLAPDRPRALRLLRRVRNTGQRRAALAGPAGLRPGPRPPVGPRAARATSVLLRDVRGRGTLVVAERVPVSGHRHRLHGRPHIELPGRCALRCRRMDRRLPAPIPPK
ncbi:MAG: hypothetical protein DMD51_12535 [Gemmatimonadetes bacterium]|nr:MAG: hypothetical protein DMD51_12535 [Gemmatimonadota bacterium]